jgi:hypothetical protein
MAVLIFSIQDPRREKVTTLIGRQFAGYDAV